MDDRRIHQFENGRRPAADSQGKRLSGLRGDPAHGRRSNRFLPESGRILRGQDGPDEAQHQIELVWFATLTTLTGGIVLSGTVVDNW